MKIRELLCGIPYTLLQGDDERDVGSISWDSRKVKAGALFICVKGRRVDRHDFVLQAVDEGAIAVVAEQEVAEIPAHICVVKVDNSRIAMAFIASRFYGEPSRRFNLVGVTGTNGKTSVTCYIAGILEAAGRKAGVIGTIENRIGNEKLMVEKINPTTPDSIELQAAFREMADKGVTDVAMEVTSSALEQHRVDCCDFDTGVFTNLTQDHLDEHGTMENYKNAKLKLFGMCRRGVVNIDDPVSKDILGQSGCAFLTYGIDCDAELTAREIKHSVDGVTFSLVYQDRVEKTKLSAPGKFSVYNALAATGACLHLGLTLEQIAAGLRTVAGVRGRFEAVPNPRGCLVIVDYAHTPDGLENVLNSARELTQGRLITVFGCGGDRDRAKRPVMGEAAGRLSSFCVITSDNPRTEEPMDIIREIEEGVRKSGCPYSLEADRRLAIHLALDMARAGDSVVIAGKGHETYQIFKDKTIHFDDVEIVKEYFGALDSNALP